MIFGTLNFFWCLGRSVAVAVGVSDHSLIVFWMMVYYLGSLIKLKLSRQTIYFQESSCDIGNVRVLGAKGLVNFLFTITACARSRKVCLLLYTLELRESIRAKPEKARS